MKKKKREILDGPAEGGPGQGGPGQEGTRQGVQGRCYRLEKRGLKNKTGLNNIWSGLEKHMARSSKT